VRAWPIQTRERSSPAADGRACSSPSPPTGGQSHARSSSAGESRSPAGAVQPVAVRPMKDGSRPPGSARSPERPTGSTSRFARSLNERPVRSQGSGRNLALRKPCRCGRTVESSLLGTDSSHWAMGAALTVALTTTAGAGTASAPPVGAFAERPDDHDQDAGWTARRIRTASPAERPRLARRAHGRLGRPRAGFRRRRRSNRSAGVQGVGEREPQ
jgi:hypothetical protein